MNIGGQIALRDPNFRTWAQQNGSAKKGVEKKMGHSAVNKGVTRGYIINTHKRIHGVGSKKHVPRPLEEIRKFAVKVGTPDVSIDTRLSKAIWEHPTPCHVQLSRKHNEDEDSLSELYTSVT
ncbi:large ribosomal subunit protein eL31-like [Microcebus murinus]|uniref:large ribosomal subunit protein eL31-like n=1 Tax=Microcebus murinus TaxID=30608 RepID=UPI003F6D1EF9